MNYELISYDESTRIATIAVIGCVAHTSLVVPLEYETVEAREVFYENIAQEVLAEVQRQAASGEVPDAAPPLEPLTQIQILELKAAQYINFGVDLYHKIKRKVWALNTLAISQGTPLTISQTMTLLAYSVNLENTLKTGSLASAKYVLGQLNIALPQYAAVCAYANSEIDTFMAVT
jgi:hypothetical protein